MESSPAAFSSRFNQIEKNFFGLTTSSSLRKLLSYLPLSKVKGFWHKAVAGSVARVYEWNDIRLALSFFNQSTRKWTTYWLATFSGVTDSAQITHNEKRNHLQSPRFSFGAVARSCANSDTFRVAQHVVVRSRGARPRTHPCWLVNRINQSALPREEGGRVFTARYKYSWHMFYFKVAASDRLRGMGTSW